jgi:23S rRNA A2030 N6-methylase RlmJ
MVVMVVVVGGLLTVLCLFIL